MMLRTGNNPCPPHPEKGVTLVEILLAVVILSVGISGILQAYGVAVTALETGQDYVETMQLLKGKMAEIEQEIIEGKGLSAGSSRGVFEGGFKNYQWEREARPSSVEGLLELQLTVSHPRKSRSVAFVTYAENKDYEPRP